jgi:putative serine protease PepD
MQENNELFENRQTQEQASQELPPAQEQAAPSASLQPPMMQLPQIPQTAWDFGGQEPKKKSGIGAFFAIFGGVLALCIALLVATLFLGDGGFQIIKTLHSERVIYVREDDGTSGLLTPNEAADVVKKSTVTISVKTATGGGIGSGFVYDANGHICTNYHVI